MMKCERCNGNMLEEELIVVGGIVRVKDVSAWHCVVCGRIEYRSKVADRSMVELEATG
jgi:YgiT-type zinc finger domain-containing protein